VHSQQWLCILTLKHLSQLLTRIRSTYIIGYITSLIGQHVLETIFGGKNVEKVLFFLLKNERCFGRELSLRFEEALSPFQKTLDRLEDGGVLVSFLEGKTRVYQYNPRYPFLKELKAFLEKAYSFLPEEIREKYYEPKVRKRPRKKGKPL